MLKKNLKTCTNVQSLCIPTTSLKAVDNCCQSVLHVPAMIDADAHTGDKSTKH